MTWIVVGASSGLGRALSERLAAAGKPLLLVARDARDLEALARDLSSRFRADVMYCPADAADPASLSGKIANALGGRPVEGLLFPVGAVDDADRANALPANSATLIATNFVAVVEIVRQHLPEMLRRGSGTIVGFGSVAAIRGRTANAVYAASKAALGSFFESLLHACDGTGVLVQFYILGYLDTNLSFGRRLLFPKARPSVVAERVVRNLGRGGGIWYLPSFWKVIAVAVRLLPWPIFRRLNF